MGKVLIVAMFFLGCVVMCYSHPVLKQEPHINNEENIENPTLIKKERHKRTANPPDKSEDTPVDQSVQQPVEHLANDAGFLKNLELVFGSQTERKQIIAPANFVFEASLNNFTNENNTGIEDRLRSFKELQAFVRSTVTPNNGLNDDSKDDQGIQPLDDQLRKTFGHPSNSVDHATVTAPEMGTETTKQLATNFEDNQMLQVFGAPPVQTKQLTVTPPQTVTQKKQHDENTADTDKSSASASEENHGKGKNGSSKKITLIYLYFISLIFVLVCS